jgi:phospholipase/carboxylesterase
LNQSDPSGTPTQSGEEPSPGLHAGQPVLARGSPLEDAQKAMILVHGRGADANAILALTAEVDQPGFAYLAPQAAGNAWYPNRFLASIAENEPWLSSALAVIEGQIKRLNDQGILPERTILLGFSQGACLALEYAARNARRYGGLIGLSGGLIGPPGTRWENPGTLDGTPVFLGCGDPDPHIPRERVLESETALKALGAEVTARLYPGLGHTVNRDELQEIRRMMANL